MSKTKLPLKFYSPKYWPMWVAIGFLRVIALLPYSWMLAISRFMGKRLYPLAKRRTHIIETNIRLCFPELSKEQQKAMAVESLISSFMAIFEIAISWWSPRQRVVELHESQGVEHLEAAMAKGKGVILLVTHFTTMEIAGNMLNTHINNLNVIYKRSRNELLEWFTIHKRDCKVTKHKDLRGIVRSVKGGDAIWYAPDQDYGTKDSIFAPFMGVQTSTLVTTAKLAKLTGAPVVPFFAFRRKDNQGYTMHISPALENFPSGDDLKDATAVNQAIEHQIAQAPEQYLWAHRRFKTRPAGEKDVYS